MQDLNSMMWPSKIGLPVAESLMIWVFSSNRGVFNRWLESFTSPRPPGSGATSTQPRPYFRYLQLFEGLEADIRFAPQRVKPWTERNHVLRRIDLLAEEILPLPNLLLTPYMSDGI